MKKIVPLLLVGFVWLIQPASGQSPDSLAIVTQNWNTTVVDKGIVWKHAHFDELFGSPQDVNLVEINLRKHRKKVRIAADSVRLDSTSSIAAAHDALVAINGGFFDMKNGGSVDFVKADGEVINHTREQTDRANAVLLVSRRKIEIKPATDDEYVKMPNVLLSGPMLIQDGAAAMLSSNPFNDNRHPRSAIAIASDRKLIFLVVDGRNRQSAGMSLPELTRVLKWLGANDAMNLDGGGSSTLYVKGTTKNGVVNHPSDNKLFDHLGQRPVANVIYVAD